MPETTTRAELLAFYTMHLGEGRVCPVAIPVTRMDMTPSGPQSTSVEFTIYVVCLERWSISLELDALDNSHSFWMAVSLGESATCRG